MTEEHGSTIKSFFSLVLTVNIPDLLVRYNSLFHLESMTNLFNIFFLLFFFSQALCLSLTFQYLIYSQIFNLPTFFTCSWFLYYYSNINISFNSRSQFLVKSFLTSVLMSVPKSFLFYVCSFFSHWNGFNILYLTLLD